MSKKLVVIANPFSGTSTKSKLEKILHELNGGYFDLEVKYTEYAGHAKILAADAILEGAEIIAAAGGDGTVNEVASQVSGTEATLGILPGGSGNGFAMHLGLGRDAIKAFDMLKKGKTSKVDSCWVNDVFFINVSGLGFDARVAYLTKHNKKKRLHSIPFYHAERSKKFFFPSAQD
ncbi:MAG: hypothetical protein IPN29_11130 [Saprospiraceae bacterium]|nr:hypothetical protein [Saprospiraceae bacterium]